MADVQLIRWSLAVVAAAKVVDVLVRDDPTILAVGWLAAALVAAAAARPGCLAVGAMGAASNVWFEASNHTSLIMWMGLMGALLRPEDIGRVAQVLGVTVYVFASAHKLLGGTFLDGGHIADRFFWDDAPVELMAHGAVVAQVGLAVLVLLRTRWALPAAVGLHVGIVVVMSSMLGHWLRLGGFNGLMIVLVHLATAGGSWYPLGRPVRPPAPALDPV